MNDSCPIRLYGEKGFKMKLLNTACHGMDIEIKAKWSWKERSTQDATEGCLNYISILASEAAESFETRGSHSLAKQAREFADQIYDLLKSRGVYDE